MSKFVFERSNEQLHKQLLDLMVVFKEICDKEGIWYSLAFGTMLGAVRHGGFIPWDLDADVVIMLPDKEKFREAFAKHKPDGITLRNYDTDPRCLQAHDVLLFDHEIDYIGKQAHLDIYPLIGAPSSPKAQARFAFRTCYEYKVIKSKHVDIRKCNPKNRPLVMAAKAVCSFLPDRQLKEHINRLETRFDFESSEYLITISNYGTATSCIPKAVWMDTQPMRFEGIDFNVPKDWHTYLARTFGEDYMTPKRY